MVRAPSLASPLEAKLTLNAENTLNILFSAQKQQQQQQAEPSYPEEPTMSMSPPPPQQPSLHSFWALPARPTSRDSSANSGSLSTPAYCQETNCEDCDTVLVNGDGDAMDMDIDVDMYGGGGDGSSDFACSQCRRQICHQCAVSNLGEQRQCLMCAGRRRWVGGLGWVNV